MTSSFAVGAFARRLPGLVLALALVGAGPATAQTLFQGRIDVTVQDAQDRAVPGATVEIAGPATQQQVSDTNGEAHFLNLAPGVYTLTVTLAGFTTYRNETVRVAAGSGVPLKATLQVGGVTETVQVNREAPVIDPARQTVTTGVSYEELQQLPSARDPWVVLQTVPGVVVDRVNVGGAESGQQSNYLAKGAGLADNTWNLDGIPVTDLAATGSSPTYYNFDMFQEMSVTTGGASATNPTAGVQLNMQFKTGANRPSGAAHIYGAGEGLQSTNLPDELAELAGESGKGNRMKDLTDYGFDLGGPVIRDRWWAWGSYGRTESTLFTLNGDPDKTTLENVALKSTAQLNPRVRPEFLFFRGNKTKIGRGASPLRAPETTWNQSGPTPLYKGQVNLILGNNVFLTARAGYVGNGFTFDPQGGLDVSGYRDAGRVRHGSFYYYATDRPDFSTLVDGNWVRGVHEVTFGGSWRKTRDDETQIYPGTGADSLHSADYATTRSIAAWIWRPFFASSETVNQSLYVGDTIKAGRLTTQLSLRYDRAYASMLESPQSASPGFPDLLPAITSPAESKMIDLGLWSPRIGATYALDDTGRTLLRASYGMFGSQLGSGTVQGFSAASLAVLIYSATDRNGNNIADPGELDELVNWGGVDPEHPGSGINFNRVDPDLKSPKTHELTIGIDRELAPDFGISAAMTWRRFNDVIWSGIDLTTGNTVYPLVGVSRADYVQEGVVEGTIAPLGAYNQAYYAPRPESLPLGNGAEYRNRPDYHQRYLGFEVQATKRMSNRWMGRVGFSTNSHKEYFDDPSTAVQDPTPSTTWPNIAGGAYVTQTNGSGKSEIYLLLPRYQLTAGGVYQLPYRINIAGSIVAREGFGQPFFSTVESADPGLPEKRVLLVDPDDNRLPGVFTLDLRAEKGFAFRGGSQLMLTMDMFNVLNSSTTLGRQYDVTATGSTGFYKTLEIMNPRLIRLGMRFQF
jgi:carboxypeptidase family protein/TonB-dependent receptor-like protein